jgi:hypothetical protein
MSDWPQEVRKVIRLANFRPDFKTDRPRRERARDRRAGMSSSHLARIRQLQCTVCYERRNLDAHHLKSGPARSERGIGLKATDRWAIPLCRIHHDEVERLGSRREPGYFDDYGIEPHCLADALWRQSSDRDHEKSIDNMLAVLHRHQIQAIAKLSDRAHALRKGARR